MVRKIYILVFVLIGLTGCQKDQDEAALIVSIDEEFYIDIKENLSPQGRQIAFSISTLETFPCINHKIIYDFSSDKDQMLLHLQGIQEGSPCQPGQGPAKVDVLVEGPIADQVPFTITLQETVLNQGRFISTPNQYLVDFDNPNGIVWIHNSLSKIPQDCFWGVVGYDSSLEDDTALSFLSELESMAAPLQLASGYYSFFSINTDGKLDVSLGQDFPIRRAFLFRNNNSTYDPIYQLIDNYRLANQGRLHIEFMNSEGETY